MDTAELASQAANLANAAQAIARDAAALAQGVTKTTVMAAGGADPFLFLFTVFVLACFIGFYVVWSVTPALHSPLMSVTNAISSVIVVGALIAAGPEGLYFSKTMGLIAVVLASINIFGGFIVTGRMLSMFRKKKK